MRASPGPIRRGRRQWLSLSLLATCAVAGCTTVDDAAAQPAEIRYAGTLSGCGQSNPATLTRIRGAFAFAPSDGVLVLRGTVAADGSLSATLNTQPPTKPPFLLTVHGHATTEAATVSYTTPVCPEATATLTRVRRGWL